MTPAIDEDYWSHRIRLTERQSLVAFGTFGTVAVDIASTKRAPARIIPLCSASAPTMNPETSWTNRSGVECRSQFSMKYAVFSADSV